MMTINSWCCVVDDDTTGFLLYLSVFSLYIYWCFFNLLICTAVLYVLICCFC